MAWSGLCVPAFSVIVEQSYTGVGRTRIKTIKLAESTSVDTSCLALSGRKARDRTQMLLLASSKENKELSLKRTDYSTE